MDILIIEQSQLMREALCRLFVDNDIPVFGAVKDIQLGVGLVRDGRSGRLPDMILLDLAEVAGLERLAEIKSCLPLAHVVVLTHLMSADLLTRSLWAGVDGYLVKDMSSEALVQSLKLVDQGEKVLPTNLAMLLAHGPAATESSPVKEPSYHQSLSTREVQILRSLLNGQSNKAIARELDITEATVKVHLKGVLRKVNVANRTQAAIWALNHGLGDPQPGVRAFPAAPRNAPPEAAPQPDAMSPPGSSGDTKPAAAANVNVSETPPGLTAGIHDTSYRSSFEETPPLLRNFICS